MPPVTKEEIQLRDFENLAESLHNHPQMEATLKIDNEQHLHTVIDTDLYEALRSLIGKGAPSGV